MVRLLLLAVHVKRVLSLFGLKPSITYHIHTKTHNTTTQLPRPSRRGLYLPGLQHWGAGRIRVYFGRQGHPARHHGLPQEPPTDQDAGARLAQVGYASVRTCIEYKAANSSARSLFYVRPHSLDTDNFGHASLREVLPWVDELNPERVYLVGAGCGWGDHDKANEELATKRGYPHVQLAHDGLFLEGFRLYE